MADSLFLSTLKASRRQKYGDLDIQEFSQMFKEGATDKIPADLAYHLIRYRPQNDDELSLWVYTCLEKQGLSAPLTRLPNHLQTDLPNTCSHLDYLGDVFFERVENCIVLGNRGGGKCLGKGTPVMMWDGTIKPVEDVQVGDKLMGDDSTPRTVLSTTVGFGDLYKVTPKKGDPYIVNDVHILSLKYGKLYDKKGNLKAKSGQVVDISVQDYLASNPTQQELLKGYRVPIRKFQDSDKRSYTIPPYLLGVWLGDGSRYGFSITTHEPEIISYLYEIADIYNLGVRVVPEKTKNIAYATYHLTTKQRGRGHKHPFFEYLRQNHLNEHKFIPHEYKTGSWEDRLEILAGLLDTDGSLTHDGSCIEITSKYKQLAEDIAFIARSLGLAGYVKEEIRTCTNSPAGPKQGVYYRLRVCGQTEIIPLRVARRKPHPRQLSKDVLLTGIQVEPYGQGEYYGFEIDGNRRFLLGDFTVTHNTLVFAIAMFLEAYFKPEIEIAHLGAIEDQAKRCYRYFRKIVEHPLFVGTLARQASGSRAEFANGSIVEILVGTMAGVNGPHCWVGHTLIDCSRNHTLYPNGVPIKELVGKSFIVPTINEYTGEVTYKKARGLYSGKLPCIEITLAKPDRHGHVHYSTLVCTSQHKLMLAKSHRYVYAGLLQVGDRLQVARASSYIHKANPKYGTRHTDTCNVRIAEPWTEVATPPRTRQSEHRLIAEAWFGGIPSGYIVHHKDGNRLNNDVSNLEPMSPIDHQHLHFGEDCQGFITDSVKQQIAQTVSIAGDISGQWRDKNWLQAELQTKPYAQIAYEQRVHYETIHKWTKIHHLSYRTSSKEFTKKMCDDQMLQLKIQQGNIEATEPITAHVSTKNESPTPPYQQPIINNIPIKPGAWTVIAIKPYKDGEPQDVYDIEVEGEQTSNHNYQVQGVVSHNSQHVSIDEVELMDWAILQEAFNMARDAKGYKGATRLTSTRKKNSGTMQKIIDEADKRGLKIYQWNLWDTVETCPLTTDSNGHIIDTQEVYFETDDLGNQVSTMVYKSCLSCPMLAGCKGQAKTSNAGPKAVVSLDDAKKLYTSLDASVWDAQVICIKPGSESMVYPMFKPEIHVIDYQTALKQKYGENYDHIFDVEYEVYAGQDAGFICPATVFLQVIDDPETGDQLIVIFDELYEHNIAPSKYIREFLWPKHREYNVQEWFCDPSNSAQLMAEMEEQDLYPVEGLKSVDEGIDACRAAFSLGHLLIDKSCKNLIWELNRYEKNPNTGRPVKVDDHLVDAMRYGVNGVGLYQNVVDTIYT